MVDIRLKIWGNDFDLLSRFLAMDSADNIRMPGATRQTDRCEKSHNLSRAII